ncbi:uncharacterized protein LOC116120538 [Pistacia vera]|uniref:uncharacterized protein LOC116120538 n=1 Tax=Pistacia vera TaxID=55513 RepID=UPI0012632267|nr:uncharacterized protein LOC116120538 [Pistacia vera]
MRYLQKGHSQPHNHKFLKSKSGDYERSFQRSWFDKYLYWLEYSVENDAAYCLCCYLFKPDKGEQSGAKQNEEYRLAALEKALRHDKLIAPSIQKDIINAFAVETINKLISDLGDAFFSILVDEARDGSNKEQMIIILLYVNKRGCVVECLFIIMHITDTTALSLKMGIETLFSKYNLSISILRGQGYDGASNIHRDLLNEKQAWKVKKAIESGELSTGQGLNQDTSLKRPGETRWGSHFGTLLSLINLFSFVIEVLEDFTENSDNGVEANLQLSELNSRFNEGNTELLICMASLNPSDYFKAFDKGKLVRFAQFYPLEFSSTDLMTLELKLDNYIDDMRSDSDFSELNDITSLAQKMVEKKKHLIYSLVYLLITLALTLPVAITSVERAFSAMKIVKTHLRNRMRDQFLNDSLIPYVEKDLFDSVDKEIVMQ